MKIRISYITHQGKKRNHNEDAIMLMNEVIQINEMSIPIVKDIEAEKVFFAVADGIGGSKAGELASRKVLMHLKERWKSITSKEKILGLIQKTHLNLIEYAQENPSVGNYGTTIAGLFIENLKAIIFNVGDSRIYRENQGFLEQLSIDQSLMQSLVDQKMITPEEAIYHPKKNVILESIGGELKKRNIEIKYREIKIKEEDIFIICSDGLTDMLNIDEMESCLKENITISIKNLFRSTMKKGGLDNISIMIIKIVKLKGDI